MKKRLKTFLFFIPLIALAFFISTNVEHLQKVEAKEQEKKRILPVHALSIEFKDFYETSRQFTGVVNPFQNSPLGFEFGGKITQTSVQEGDFVEENTLLATLETTLLQIDLKELMMQELAAKATLKEMENGPRAETIAIAKSAYEVLQKRLELARKQYRRTKTLIQEGNVSSEEHDENESNLGVLEAEARVAKKRLEELLAGTRSEKIENQVALIQALQAQQKKVQSQIDKSILKAPHSGIISFKNAEVGQIVQQGEVLFHLVQQQKLKVQMNLPFAVAQQIQIGQSYELEIENQKYPAKVFAKLPILNEATYTVTVVFHLEQKEQSLYLGQLAHFYLQEKNSFRGFWLPMTSLLKGNYGLWSCYVLTPKEDSPSKKNYIVEKRNIEVLHVLGQNVYVTGNLQAQEKVIQNGIHRIVPFQEVQLQSENKL